MKTDIVERLTMNAQWLHRDGFDTSANNAIDAKAEILSLRQRVQELEKERDSFKDAAEYNKRRADDAESQRDELLAALENLLPWVVTQTVACNGMKCRELVCISCTEESEAEQYAQEACDRYRDAKQVIASVKEKQNAAD